MDALGKFGAAPRATLKLLSCSQNFPRASITRYTHAKHEPILNYYFILLLCCLNFSASKDTPTDVSLFNFQFTRTVLKSTRRVNVLAVFSQSSLIMLDPLMCSVTKQQPVGGGQCSRRDWMARLISTAVGMTTNKASEI